MTFEDFPLIRLKPAPSDAELAAERQVKHEADLREWFSEPCRCGHHRDEHYGEACWHYTTFDQYGTHRCGCRRYRTDSN